MNTVKKYLIFRNNPASGKSIIPGSPEDIACDIAMGVKIDGHLKNTFIAYPADSPEATFATIQSAPLFSIELDQAKINAWINDVEPLLHKIYYFDDVVNEAQSLVMSAFSDLEESIEESIIFKDVDLTSEISISNAFEEIGRPDEYEFTERLEEEFSVEKFVRYPARSV
jgi:hypothetical protein